MLQTQETPLQGEAPTPQLEEACTQRPRPGTNQNKSVIYKNRKVSRLSRKKRINQLFTLCVFSLLVGLAGQPFEVLILCQAGVTETTLFPHP